MYSETSRSCFAMPAPHLGFLLALSVNIHAARRAEPSGPRWAVFCAEFSTERQPRYKTNLRRPARPFTLSPSNTLLTGDATTLSTPSTDPFPPHRSPPIPCLRPHFSHYPRFHLPQSAQRALPR